MDTSPTAGDEVLDLPNLTDAALDFLASEYYEHAVTELQKTFALTGDDISFLNELDHVVLGGAMALDAYVDALRDEFPSMDASTKDQLIARLLAERFMPFGDDLKPSAQEVARQCNIALPSVAYYRVYTSPLTFGGAAGEVARMVGMDLMGDVRERLRDLLMSRVNGTRTDAQVKERLVATQELGGMGMDDERANAVLLAMNDIVHRATLMTEEAYSAWIAQRTKTRRDTDASENASVGIATSSPEEDEDHAEIASVAAKMPTPVRDTASVLALATETTLKRLSEQPTDPYLRRRLENIVSTRLRDVRSQNETLLKLMREVKVGGMGLERDAAEALTAEIEEGYAEFHGLIAQEEQESIQKQASDQEKKIEERKQREAEEHAQWFEEKMKTKRMQEEAQQRMVSQLRILATGVTTPVHPIDVKERLKEQRAFGELVPPVSSPGVPTPLQPAPTVKVSVETAKAQAVATASSPRPRMDDVTVVRAPHLSGPIQELESLTLDQFRRLGKTPKEAVERIMEKMRLLEQESFEHRVHGVRAWQQSPLHALYTTLVAEAFRSGTPMYELVAQKSQTGERVPTAEELSAIVDMNSRIHL
jgi:hypothetical protein